MEQLKTDLKEKLIANSKRESELKFTQSAVDKAVDDSEVEIPETLIRQEIKGLKHRFEHNLAAQGLTMDQYLSYTQKTEEQVLEDFRPEALKRVKTDLVLSSIAKAEKIEVDDAELDAKITELASLYQPKDPLKLRRDLVKNGRISEIEQAILLEKTVNFIRDNVES
jgi:trigger factor